MAFALYKLRFAHKFTAKLQAMEVIRTDSNNEDFRSLVVMLDKDLAIRDGDDHAFYAQFNKIDLLRNAVVLYEDGVPVGCGAFKSYSEDSVEVKRMYVLPEYRGKRLAVRILEELEKWASEEGFKFAVLETGKNQPEAIKLYHNCGYEVTENYGQYVGVSNSVCFRKKL